MIAWTISGLNSWLSHVESCSTLIANSSLNDQKRRLIRKLTKKKQQYDAQHVTLSMNHSFKSQQISNAQGKKCHIFD